MAMTHGTNTCAMSEKCEGKEADHGLLCAEHRAEDRLITDECLCFSCRSDCAGIAPCVREGEG